MQKEVVKDQNIKDGSAWGYVRTIECECGYIATFETWKFDCPDCKCRHYLFSNNVRHLTKRALDAGDSAASQVFSPLSSESTSEQLPAATQRK